MSVSCSKTSILAPTRAPAPMSGMLPLIPAAKMAQEGMETAFRPPPHRTSIKAKALENCPILSLKVPRTEFVKPDQKTTLQCTRTRRSTQRCWGAVLTCWQKRQNQHWQRWPGRNTLPASQSSPSHCFPEHSGAQKGFLSQENQGTLSEKSPQVLQSLYPEDYHGAWSLI